MAKPDKDDRLFAPFDIGMDEHPKIIGLSDAAFRALFEATFFSRRQLTDGFLDERIVARRWGLEVAEELSSNDPESPSWVRVDGVKPGWRIHDFEKHHPLRAEIEARKAELSEIRSRAGRAGGRKSGEARRKQTGSKPEAKRSSEAEAETQTETTPPSNEGGEGPPPRKCSKHDYWDHDEPCRACWKDRLAAEAWEAEQARKPRPIRPHEHKWLDDGTCLGCEQRKEAA